MDRKPPHFISKPQRKYTFMLVPNHSGQIYRFSIPAWIPKTAFCALAITLCGFVFGTWYFAGELEETKQALTSQRIVTAQLTEENQDHLEEIDFLKSKYHKIDEQLASLQKLENQVLDMVGLNSDDSPKVTGEGIKEPSVFKEDDHPLLAMVTRSASSRSIGPRLDHYQVDVNSLNDLIASQKNKMEQLVDDVENQLEYLEAKPNSWPAQGRISSPFGKRISPTNRRTTEFHQGIDIANTSGTAVVAAGSGIVTYSGYNGGYGRMIIISHGYGYTSVYAHNSQNLVDVGDQVNQGDLIARIGQTGRATGPHLHFEVRVNGEPKNPKNFLP